MLALIGREEMHNHITIVEQEPTFLGLPFYAALFLIVFLGRFQYPFGKRIQHTVAGAVAEDEIVGEGRNVLNVEEQDVFALSILQGFNDFMCKFECVQISPHISMSLRGAFVATKQSPRSVGDCFVAMTN